MRQGIREYQDVHIHTFAVTVMIRVVELDGVGYAVNLGFVGVSPPCIIAAGTPCTVTVTVPTKLIDRRTCILSVDENGRAIGSATGNGAVLGRFLFYKITVVVCRLVKEHGGKPQIRTVKRRVVNHRVITVAPEVPAVSLGTETSQ